MPEIMTVAAAATGTTGTGSTPATGTDLLSSLLIFIVPLAIMYFLLLRPQKKKEKAVAEMRKALAVGDEVVTIGGVVGRVVGIKDDVITIESGVDKNKLKFKRWAIQEKINKDEA